MGGSSERGQNFSQDGQADSFRSAYDECVVVAGILEELSPSHGIVPKPLKFNPWVSPPIYAVWERIFIFSR